MIWRTSRQSLGSKGLLGNRPILKGIAVEFLLLWLIIGTDTGRSLFKTASPPLGAWLVPIPFAIAMLALSELRKRRSRRHEKLDESLVAAVGPAV